MKGECCGKRFTHTRQLAIVNGEKAYRWTCTVCKKSYTQRIRKNRKGERNVETG